MKLCTSSCVSLTNFKAKCLIVFLAVQITCLGQELWHGTRHGMSKAKLQALFGTQLAEKTNPRSFVAYTSLRDSEHICGADFEVSFAFLEGRLSVVDLESQSGNPGGAIGQCVLNQYIAKWGNPYRVEKIPAIYTGSNGDGADYWFKYRRFSRGRLVLHVNPKRVMISYFREAYNSNWISP